MKKVTLTILIVGLVGAVLSGAAPLFFVSKLPAQSGAEKIAGLSTATKIMRDAHGVPHIFASHMNDGFTALGYLHASDRLFQMEMMRRAGSGRLSEILGKDLIPYDKKMRGLGFYALIEPYYKGLSRDARAALDAYASGVNAYMAKGNFPAEFVLLGFKPSEWKPWDGLIWAKMMAWQLSGNFEDEVFREQLLQHGMSKKQIEAMYPVLDHDVPSTMKPLEWALRDKGRGMRDGVEKHVSLASINKSQSIPLIPHLSSLSATYERLPRTASNAYVISGAHTKSKKPILANDPHLQLQAPILWYLARIVTPQGELKGASAPGLPFFPLGQNSHVAWGFTTSNMDVQDVTFIPAQSKDFTSRNEIIHVKDAPDVAFEVEENNQGVVISGIINGIQDITPAGKKALLQFTGLNKNDRTVEALYRMNTAKNAAEIEGALKDYSVPPQNLLYADKDGHVGYVAAGLVPQRSGGGFYASENKIWNGAMANTPRLKDPSAGLILTANQAIVDDKACKAFTCAFARDWAEPYRAMRLEELFAEQFKTKEPLDVQRASEAMLDVTSLPAKRFMPVMLDGVSGNDNFEKEILGTLRRWDGRMLRERPEPLIYHVWLDTLMRQQFKEHYTSDVIWPRMSALEQQVISKDVMNKTFSAAMSALKTRHGDNWQKWRWGDEHKAPLAHPLWSHVPLINQLTSLQTETDGDAYTLRRAAPVDFQKPFADEHGAGYRGVYDLNDPAQSLFIIAGGESGQLFSPYYGNMRDAWRDGAFITLTGSEQELQKAGAPVLMLMP